MDYNQTPLTTEIITTLPIKISFTAIENYLLKKYVGEVISKADKNGKIIKYAKILDIRLSKSNAENFNLEIIVTLQSLTFLYNDREFKVTVSTEVKLDIENQVLFIKNYQIDSKGKSWLANQMFESIVNKFNYKKIIEKLAFDLKPILSENLNLINDKLASQLKIKEGVSIIGSLENLTIPYIRIKDEDLWILVNINVWGIINIDSLDFE